MPTPRKSKTITFLLPPELVEQVQAVVRSEGRSKNELVREELRNYVEEREWLRAIRYERLTETRAFVRSFVERVEVNAGTATIVYAIPMPEDSPIGERTPLRSS